MPHTKPAHKPHKPMRLGAWLYQCKYLRWLYPLRTARRLYLVEHEIDSAHVPRALNGLRVAYASDIHYGQLLEEVRVRDLADRLNALQADILILGGDYGEDAATSLAFWQIVPDLHAKLAVCAVVGNHDRAEAGADTLANAMYKRGVTPLINNALFIDVEGARLAVCATDDYNHGAPDFAGVAAQVKDADYVIYAPHSPDALADAYNLDIEPFFNLALCGHTHGGQITLFGLAPNTARRHGWRYGMHYLRGQLEESGSVVIISNGVGTSWLPLRLGAPPQYHIITLRHARDDDEL